MTTSLQRFHEMSSADRVYREMIALDWVCEFCKTVIHGGIYHDCKNGTMPTEQAPVPAPQPSLRKAAAEALLAGGLLLSDAQRDSANWQQTCMARTSEERFRKALEQLAEALAQ